MTQHLANPTRAGLMGPEQARQVAASLQQGKHTVNLPAASWGARTTAGAGDGTFETATNRHAFVTKDFDAATQEHVQFRLPWPKGASAAAGLTFRVGWTAASGSGGVAWGLRAVAVGDDDPLDAAFGTAAVVTDTLIAALDMHWTGESAAVTIAGTPQVGDTVVLELFREVANASDTLAVDARLIEAQVFLTYSAGNDA